MAQRTKTNQHEGTDFASGHSRFKILTIRIVIMSLCLIALLSFTGCNDTEENRFVGSYNVLSLCSAETDGSGNTSLTSAFYEASGKVIASEDEMIIDILWDGEAFSVTGQYVSKTTDTSDRPLYKAEDEFYMAIGESSGVYIAYAGEYSEKDDKLSGLAFQLEKE